MNIEEKNKILEKYIFEKFIFLKEKCSHDPGYFINIEKYKKAISLFSDRREDISVLIEEVDNLSTKLYLSYMEWEKKQKESFLSRFDNSDIKNDNLGITLNRQMIELMLIATANNVEELKKIVEDLNIKNINFSIQNTMEEIRQLIFNSYINDLTSRNEYYKNKFANLERKIQNVINNSNIDENAKNQLKILISNSLKKNMTSSQIFELISSKFDKTTSSKIFGALLSSRDLSEVGIIDYTLEDYKALAQKTSEFKSITIDFEAKYPAVYMPNGEFYFNNLERCLNFAKNNNKETRLNALIFFEDCPLELSKLDFNETNKKIVFNKLLEYVDKITKYISTYNSESLKNNGYEVVKSIDVFNELITRFSGDFNNSYLIRENVSKNNLEETGWQKFLTIEDLCSIAMCARKNLPNVEFVYNEINLEDPKKIVVFKNVMERIKKFEKENQHLLNGKKIIDCIGTQWHLNPYVTPKDLEFSLEQLSSYGLPLKITEYDQPLSEEFIISHSHIECEEEKKKKQKSIKSFLKSNKEKYNIKQITIWSLTDKTSFLLDKRNEKLIKDLKQPVSSLYSGAFRDKRYFDRRDKYEIDAYQQIKRKNQIIKQQKLQKQQLDKPKVLTLTQSSNGFTSNNEGFTNIITLSLIVSFICGALFMIVYMLIRMG